VEYRTLGDSDIRVSRVCLGTMTFGSPVGSDAACELIRHAADAGVNFIDTANMYEGYARVAGSAGGVAEEIVGRAIAGRRDEFVVATKLGMKVGPEPWDEFTSAEAIRVQLGRSLERLGTGLRRYSTTCTSRTRTRPTRRSSRHWEPSCPPAGSAPGG